MSNQRADIFQNRQVRVYFAAGFFCFCHVCRRWRDSFIEHKFHFFASELTDGGQYAYVQWPKNDGKADGIWSRYSGLSQTAKQTGFDESLAAEEVSSGININSLPVTADMIAALPRQYGILLP